MKELSQLERAKRIADSIHRWVHNPGCHMVFYDDAIIDAKALSLEFKRLLEDADRQAERSRQNGKKGGRPISENPSKAALAKRKQRARKK